jgi:hypothetical protein
MHCDLWTSLVLSISGYKYYLVVIDDFSHYSWTFPLRAKSDTIPNLLHLFAWVSTQFGLTIKVIQCDNGCEFDNNNSRSFFLSRGVELCMSCPYTSSQNVKAERMIRTTNDVMCTLLLQASLPRASGKRAFTPPPTFSAVFLSQLLLLRLHTTLYSVPLPPTLTSVSSGVLATRTLLPLLGYSLDHKGYRCYDLASRRVLIFWHLCLTSRSSPSPPPLQLLLTLTSRHYFLTRWFSHPFLFFLFQQVLLVHHQLRRLQLRHARRRCFFSHHPWFKCPLPHLTRAWCLPAVPRAAPAPSAVPRTVPV